MSKERLPHSVWMTTHDHEVDRFFLPGGNVYNQMRDLGAMHYREARNLVPKRTRELMESHRLYLLPRGRHGVFYNLQAIADYASAVHFGTPAVIMSPKYDHFKYRFFPVRGYPRHLWIAKGRAWRGLMRIRATPSSWYPVPWLRKRVKGQDGNPWIDRSWEIAYAKWQASQRVERRGR